MLEFVEFVVFLFGHHALIRDDRSITLIIIIIGINEDILFRFMDDLIWELHNSVLPGNLCP